MQSAGVIAEAGLSPAMHDRAQLTPSGNPQTASYATTHVAIAGGSTVTIPSTLPHSLSFAANSLNGQTAITTECY